MIQGQLQGIKTERKECEENWHTIKGNDMVRLYILYIYVQ